MGHGEVWHRGQIRGESSSLLSKKWRSLEHTTNAQRWFDRIKNWARISLSDLRTPLKSHGLNATEATSKLLATIAFDLKRRNVAESLFVPQTQLPRVLGKRRFLVINSDGAQVFDQAAQRVIDLTADETAALECLVAHASTPASTLEHLFNARFRDARLAQQATESLRAKTGIASVSPLGPS